MLLNNVRNRTHSHFCQHGSTIFSTMCDFYCIYLLQQCIYTVNICSNNLCHSPGICYISVLGAVLNVYTMVYVKKCHVFSPVQCKYIDFDFGLGLQKFNKPTCCIVWVCSSARCCASTKFAFIQSLIRQVNV